MRRLLFLIVIPIVLISCQKSTRESDGYNRLIRILAIGNSYSQDALAYVPFILQSMDLDVEIQIGILMKSSANISEHVSNLEEGKAAYTFYLFDKKGDWTTQPFMTIHKALSHFRWDVIVTHQSSKSSDDWNTYYQPALNQFVSLIHKELDYPVQFAWMISQARPAITNSGENWSEEAILSHFKDNASDAKKVVEETLFEMIIPVGTAIQNARTIPELKAMGDYANNPNNTSRNGYLCSADGVHLQEGLPCQIAAYACVVSILKMLGMDYQSVYGESTRITEEWMSGKSIPGSHGSAIGSTDVNCKIAQMCAIMANKQPYEVSDINSLFKQ